LKIDKASADQNYNIIKIENLQEGEYALKLKKLGKSIFIKVHRGAEYWNSSVGNHSSVIMK
jgi:hypothetical protein